MIGSTVGRLWARAGHQVQFASRHPEELQPLVEEIGANASLADVGSAAGAADVVLLSVPLKAVPELARQIGDALAGKIVLDTGNAYEQRDGQIAREAGAHPRGSAAWAAAKFPRSRWVKAFNTVYFKTLQSGAHRQGDRLGIPLASDDSDALETAAGLVRDAGFDPVPIGGLERGREFEPGTKPYNTGMSGAELRKMFAVRS